MNIRINIIKFYNISQLNPHSLSIVSCMQILHNHVNWLGSCYLVLAEGTHAKVLRKI